MFAPTIAPTDVIGILSDNMRLRGSIIPLSKRTVSGWTAGLDLPQGGRTVLYTGQMFQLMPYLEVLSRSRAMIADSPLARLSGLGRQVNKVVNVTAFMGFPSRESRTRYNRILIDVVELLRQAGVNPGYLYEDDLYAGALVHDFGEDAIVKIQAKRILERLRKHGVEEIITVDPHTTNMMRSVLPSLVGGFDIKVNSYLEVLGRLKPAPTRNLGEKVTIHDSCLFARAENVIDEPRGLLSRGGVTVIEPVRSGQLTWCCGGPAESLYPERAAANAAVRVGQLRDTASTAVTMCPVCLVNLDNAADGSMEFQDISHYLRRAYGA